MRDTLRPEIAAVMPLKMIMRPIDHRGYPVPWFVQSRDDQGRWDFRVVHQQHVYQAITERICWVCGEKLDRDVAFVMGPMSCINHVTSEPPSHIECAQFALRTCPFMLMPQAKRRLHGLEGKRLIEAPDLIEHNPGAMAMWVTRMFTSAHGPVSMKGVILIQVGDPSLLEWWAGGQHRDVYDPLVRDRIQEAIEKLIEAGAEPEHLTVRLSELMQWSTAPTVELRGSRDGAASS